MWMRSPGRRCGLRCTAIPGCRSGTGSSIRIPERIVIHTRYDPNLIVERHAHQADQVIFVLDGEMTVGDRFCPKGTAIILETGAVFGPLVAGPEGAELLEVGLGNPLPVPADPRATRRC